MVFAFTLSHASDEINQKPFEQLIVGYNHGFIQANRKAKFEHLKEYLTEEIFNKTFIWIDSFQASNIFFDALFLNVKFDDVQMKQYSASLTTTENWKYRYIDIKKKEVVIPPTKVNYKMKYYFVRLEDGTLKINHIKILNEKSEEIKSDK